jgi:hypothetical protein
MARSFVRRRRDEGGRVEEEGADQLVQRASNLAAIGPRHRKLDKAVLDAYGWPHDLSDEEILKRLLALNRQTI